MAYLTIYCVQPFRRQGRGLERAPQRSFSRRDLALLTGCEAAAKAAGVVVFRVDVDPAGGLCSEPELLAVHGAVPPLAA